MRIRHALLAAATIASSIAAGCSNQPGSEFKEYVDDGPKDRPAAKLGRSDPDAASVRVAGPSPGKANFANDRDVLAKTLPAAVGFSSQVILSDAFVIPAEHWLAPAVGQAAAIALLSRVDAKLGPKRQTNGNAGNAAASKAVVVPREVRILVKSKDFRVEGPDGAVRVSYDDIDLLKVLNMDPVTPDAPKLMPTWLKELHGKRIRIRGFMSPAFKQTGLEGFLMGRDNKACCFPGRAKIYDLFPVRLKKGHTTDYIQNRPFDVVGTFQIKPWIEDGEILRLYQIVDAVVVQ
jgi:hypothetical protein